jgi:hypothetical protein
MKRAHHTFAKRWRYAGRAAGGIVASHLEAVNHCVLSRADVRAWRDAHGMNGRVSVPDDGATCVFIHAGAGSR